MRMLQPGEITFISSKSKPFINSARAIGIFLVVFGHTTGIPIPVQNFIYVFHMPLFFFLSGFLLSDKKLHTTIGKFFADQARKLLIPYFFFGLISWAYWAATKGVSQKAIGSNSTTAAQALLNLLFGTSERLFFNIPLWFFPCIFLVTVFYHIFFTIFHRYVHQPYQLADFEKSKVFVSIILSILGMSIAFSLPLKVYLWNCDIALVALVFFSIGVVLGKTRFDEIIKNNRFPSIMLLGLFFSIVVYVAVKNGRVDMSGMDYGNLLLFYLGAWSGIAGILIISCLIRNSSVLNYLSSNTIIIFPIHGIIFGIITAVLVFVFKLPISVKNNGYVALIYTVAALTATYPVSKILRRYFPIAIGGRN